MNSLKDLIFGRQKQKNHLKAKKNDLKKVTLQLLTKENAASNEDESGLARTLSVRVKCQCLTFLTSGGASRARANKFEQQTRESDFQIDSAESAFVGITAPSISPMRSDLMSRNARRSE